MKCSTFMVIVAALGAAACCGSSRHGSPPEAPGRLPSGAAPPTAEEDEGAAASALAAAGLDPAAIRCNSTVVWGAGLRDDADQLAGEMERIFSPFFRSDLDDAERRPAREEARRLAMYRLIRTVIVQGDTNNLGAFAVPSITVPGPDGTPRPLVVFHSATTPAPEAEGSCLRSLIEDGGVRHVVNLYAGEVPLRDIIEAEARVAGEMGATYVDTATSHRGLGEWRAIANDADASPEERAQAERAVALIVRDLVLRPGGEPPSGNVYFHCAGGMHRSTVVGGVIRRCVGGESVETIAAWMRRHGAYEDEQRPNGYEAELLDFVEAFDCSLLSEAAGSAPSDEEAVSAEP